MTMNSVQSNSPTPPRRKRWLPRIVLLLGSLLVATVLADVTVRILGLGPTTYEPRRFEPDGRVPYAQIRNGPITYLPGARFASEYDPRVSAPYMGGRVEYSINSYGFRGPEIAMEKKPGVTRIVCLGDSFTFGEGVPEQSTWPRQLEAMLNDNTAGKFAGPAVDSGGHYEVINCGVQGHQTIDEYHYFRAYVAQFKPDIVLLSFFLNDAMEGTETIRQNEEMTKAWQVSGLAKLSRIAEIMERRDIAGKRQDQYFEAIRASFDSSMWGRCKIEINNLKSLTAANGTRLIVIVWPIFWRLDGGYPFEDIHQKVVAFCKDGGIECVDLLDSFRGRSDYKYWVHPTDHHPNVLGHGDAAYVLFKHLESKSKS